MVGKTAENCGLPTISILTPLYNTPENYLREFLDSFVNQTAPNGQLCLADASDDAHPEVERVVGNISGKINASYTKRSKTKASPPTPTPPRRWRRANISPSPTTTMCWPPRHVRDGQGCLAAPAKG